VRKIKAKAKISVVVSIALLISFFSIFLFPKFVKSQEGYCGDYICDPSIGEDYNTCSQDCTGYCGDGICDPTENYDSCPTDCPVQVCGNGVCEYGENSFVCPQDCPGYCGDGFCNFYYEDPSTCPIDCPAPPYTEITGCTQITSPGEYRLVNDIIDSDASTCIDIQADNVILDCQGHTIDGVWASGTYGIYVSRSSSTATNITIKNCIVTGWFNGIDLSYSNNNTLINIASNSNYYFGIHLYYSNYNTLTNITSNSNYQDGINLYESDYNTLTNITSNSNYGSGIGLYFSNNNNLTNITSNYNSNVNGIRLYYSNYNTLTNITSNYNFRGIVVDNSKYNIIENSIIQGNSQYGIYLYGSSEANLIYNSIFNNTNNFYFDRIYTNYWNTTLTSGTNIVGGPYIGGNYWGSPDGTGYSDTCSDSNNDGICDNPYTLATDNIDYLPLAKYVAPTPPPTPPYTEITGCTQITSPGEYRLVNDIIDSDASTCIDIQADNVILDCQGHLIDGVGSFEGIRIYGNSNITIRNCILTDCSYGITGLLSYSNLTNITLNSNNYGIVITGEYNNLSDITINSSYVGIEIYGGSYNNLTNIIVTYGSNIGIFLSNSHDDVLSNVILDYNFYAITIDYSSHEIIKNSIIQNNYIGIYVYLSDNSLIYNNIFNNTNNFAISGNNYWNTTLQPGTNIWNSSLGYIGGNLWTTPDNNGYSDTCVDANFDGFCDEPYDLLGDGSNIDYLPIAKYVGQNAPTPPPAPSYTEISSCMQITQPGEYRLVNDLQLGSYPFCLEILSNDVTIDCRGYKIQDYTNSYGTRGIYIRQYYSNVTIKNCDVRGFNGDGSVGIMFDGDNSNINIVNSTLIDNNIYGGNLNTSYVTIDSVNIYNSSSPSIFVEFNNSIISNVYIESQGFNTGAIQVCNVYGCSNITVENSYIKNYQAPIWLSADDSLIYNNTIIKDNPNLPVDAAIRVVNSHNTKISGNIIRGVGNDIGIWLCCPSNDGIVIENNDIEGTDVSIGGENNQNISIVNNTIKVGAPFLFNPINTLKILNNIIMSIKPYFVNGTNIEIAYNEFRYTNISVINTMYLTDSSFHDNYAYITNDNYNSRIFLDFRIINSRNVDVYGNRLYVFNTSYVLDGYNDTWAFIVLRGSCSNVSVHDNYGYAKFPNGAVTGTTSYSGSVWHNNIYVYNNYMESTGVFCLQVCKGDGMYFYNNTILDGCIWAIGPVSNAYIYDNNISDFDIAGYNNAINNMYAYNNTLRGDSSSSPGLKIWYADVDFGTKLVGNNIFHPETDTLTPYLSVILNYSSIDYGTTEPFNSYDYIGGITVNTNMIDYKIEFDSTDLVSGANSISKNNLSFGFSKTLDFNYLLNPYNTITIFKQNLQDMFNILTRLYVPLVAPGTYTGTITITVSQGLSDNQIPNPHGGVNAQMV
jgi:parallel beta-helix repeat protein